MAPSPMGDPLGDLVWYFRVVAYIVGGYVLLRILLFMTRMTFGIKTVPAGHFRATRILGKYSRILHAGLNITYPLESHVSLSWTEVVETPTGGTKEQKREMTDFPLVPEKYDPPESEVLSSDQQMMTVNGVLWWHVKFDEKSPFAFFERTDNPMILMQEMYKQEVASTIVQFRASDLATMQYDEIARRIQKQLNEALGASGIAISRFVIQEVGYSEEMEKKLAEAAHANQALVAQLQQTATRQKIEEAESRIAHAKAQHDAELKAIATKAEADRITALHAATCAADAKRLVAILDAIRGSKAEAADWPKLFESFMREKIYAAVGRGAPGAPSASFVFTPDQADGASKPAVAAALLAASK